MRLITSLMNKGLFNLSTRELDCAELPAQNGIVHTLGTLYHCVYTHLLISFALADVTGKGVYQRIQNSTLPRSERKDVDPVSISSRELRHDLVRRGYWHPARILSVGM